MTYSNHNKVFKQLKSRPAKLNKFLKHNAPKKRLGIYSKKCRRCGRPRAHIGSYGINLCRTCFRETAVDLGFKKYN
ncbi:MAG: 30S ribosomal protein S14 [Candidatus Woesearchaeota archaeon]|nr:30S ribosomal protein S14 [Candidatus Woesearchaeota archaeon]